MFETIGASRKFSLVVLRKGSAHGGLFNQLEAIKTPTYTY